MRRSSATTLYDVAQEAGVATIPVSVVLNGSKSATRVSDTTRERIVEAAKRLNYRPNGAARGLSRSRMDTIGVVGLIESKSVNLYFLDVLTGILSAAARHNQNTTILPINDWRADENRVLQFCDGRIDGLILVAPVSLTPESAERLLRYTPYVMLHGNDAPSNTDDLDIDNEGAAFAATKHLIDLSHRRIAHFAGPMQFQGPRQRLNGYYKALDHAGIARDESYVFHGDFMGETGKARASEMLSRFHSSERPTAVFCVNDVVACACIEELTANGISIPDQISVVGFDDGPIARMTNPQLTTIRQPLNDMGQHAVDRLMFRINASLSQSRGTRSLSSDSERSNQMSPLAEPHLQIFPYQLIVRKSTSRVS